VSLTIQLRAATSEALRRITRKRQLTPAAQIDFWTRLIMDCRRLSTADERRPEKPVTTLNHRNRSGRSVFAFV
jgi:hypothetical protein